MPHATARLRSALLLAGLAIACGGDDLTLPSQGEPALLEPIGGDRQNGTVGEPLTNELVVRVLDRFNDPVPGVIVRWTAEGGGFVDPAESTTDSFPDSPSAIETPCWPTFPILMSRRSTSFLPLTM